MSCNLLTHQNPKGLGTAPTGEQFAEGRRLMLQAFERADVHQQGRIEKVAAMESILPLCEMILHKPMSAETAERYTNVMVDRIAHFSTYFGPVGQHYLRGLERRRPHLYSRIMAAQLARPLPRPRL
jgi:hypothetical protein